MTWRVGVDSGGTFTDVCLFDDETGRLEIWKTSSTPDDPSRAIARGIEEGLKNVGADAAKLGFLGHGTTVATNALIELAGVKTGLLVTHGFRDLLELARQKRPSLYDMTAEKPEILVTRDLRFGIPERLRPDGSVEVALDEDAVRAAARKLKAENVKAVAVCYLYSFLNPQHEIRSIEILREELDDVYITASHAVAPEFREFERLSTTVLNGYLGPVMRKYIERLQQRLTDLGVGAVPQLTQSNGGVIGFERAAALPVRTLLSGPSTGVVAAQEIGRQAGFGNIITFDVGGTSSDVALLHNGECKTMGEANLIGYPIKAPMLDIHTVGAGGGSIGHVDNGGLLKVGPRSAGGYPGPVCYDNGNLEATVTDANVVLQRLNPVELLGGRMKIKRDLSVAAIQRLADKLGLDVMETAEGILSVMIANIAKAVRLISVQRGYDPRDYALMAFGGAGPLHAAQLAKELDMAKIIVPRTPGTLCALGLLLTDLRADFAISRLMPVAASSIEGFAKGIAHIEQEAAEWFDKENIAADRRVAQRFAELRYKGQNYELAVAVPEGPINENTLKVITEGFEAAHQQRYGFIVKGEPIQIVTLRCAASGIVNKASFASHPDAGPDASAAIIAERDVYTRETKSFIPFKVYGRDLLRAGNIVEGPAIIEQMDTTTIVPADMRATVDAYLNLVLEARK